MVWNVHVRRKKLYKAFILSRSAESEHKYKTYKNKLTSILRLTEKTNISTLLEQQRTHVEGTWTILNKVINQKYNKPPYPEYFLKKSHADIKMEDIANGFNLFFFTNVGPNLAKKYPITWLRCFDLWLLGRRSRTYYVLKSCWWPRNY